MAIKIINLPPTTIVTAGVSVPVATSERRVTSITVQADADNADSIFIGGEGVTSSNGIEIAPGKTAEVTPDAVGRGFTEELLTTEVYIVSDTAGTIARSIIFIRRN